MGDARIGVDVGGTFTDVVLARDGEIVVWKLPSTPQDQSEGFERGVREVLDRAGAPTVASIAHGTTVATNAVLERRGAPTGLLTTDGFRDVLVIGRQNRPALYDLWADRPAPLVPPERAAGVVERIDKDGSVVVALDEDDARAAIARVLDAGAESIAVCLLFSFADDRHERRLRELIAERAPAVRVSLSSEVLPEFREYERASTTALDAFVGPVMERYVERIRGRVADLEAPVVVMRSGGGTMSLETAAHEPVHTVLSGPAGGARGGALVARAAGYDDVVTFDMGGTSTDVCLVEGGEPTLATASTIDGLPFRTPALAVHTVGAGGGSVLWVDEAGALRAGPRSAGAVPGPACYGRGGTEPAITDAHVVLGHLDPDTFLGGRMQLDAVAARAAISDVARALGRDPDEVAAAGLEAARAAMASAIRVVTVERGHDPRGFALVAFGGAGPMHATAVAEALGITTVLIPPAAGVLSAMGLLAAPLTADASRTTPMVDPDPADVEKILASLTTDATDALRAQRAEVAGVERMVDCRYLGQAHEVMVDAEPIEELAERFAVAHRARFSWDASGDPIEVVTFRARAVGPDPEISLPAVERSGGARPRTQRAMTVGGETIEVSVLDRSSLGAGARLEGPCVVDGEESTTLIDPGWTAEVDRQGTIVVVRS